MKLVLAFNLIVLTLSAQMRAVLPAQPVHPAGALGGSGAVAVIGRPLGGVAAPSFPGFPSLGAAHKARKTQAATRYVGPVYYVPNASDYASAASAEPEPQPAPPTQQPIVINQYFSNRESPRPPGWQPPIEEPVTPGNPIGPPENYYLIAYKNHSVYSALAYWLEGDTLHYVTTGNTHNQASLALIDIEQSTKLNADRPVPFTLAGK